MSLEKILSISGKPGLYELKTQTRGGFVAESLLDGKKLNVSTRHNVSMLSEISMYTYNDEVPLNEVFQKISTEKEGKEALSHKEPAEKLEAFFREVLPEYDEDRVYGSDIKKVVQWYNLLNKKGITDFSEPQNESEEKDAVEKQSTEKENSETPKAATKKSKPKSAAPKTTASKPSAKKAATGKNTAARKK